MRIGRRALLGLIGAGAAVGTARAAPAEAAYRHGVAAGDPLADGFIIWTRLSGVDGQVETPWEVALDPAFKRVVARGTALTGPGRDYCVKVDVRGLRPGVEHYYRFGPGSPVGRAGTLPVGKVKDLVLVSACCALYPGGYFNAYQAIADLPRVDAVVHLGDYIYESAGQVPADYAYDIGVKLGRLPDPPWACVTLSDYRRRFAQARADAQLQAAHARCAWICAWDDHDQANDSWRDGAQAHDPATQGPWSARKAAAVQAYYEWLPIREPAPGAAFGAINRSVDFGDLATLLMLETRLTARDHQLDYGRDMPLKNGQPDLAAFAPKLADPTRRMLGAAQEAWVGEVLTRSVKAGRPWQIIGSGTTLARVRSADLKDQMTPAAWDSLTAGITGYYKAALAHDQAYSAYDLPFGLDSWSGYPAARQRLYDLIQKAGARALVLSGDSHMVWACDLHDDFGVRVAAEFGATALTSPGYGDSLPPGTPLGPAFAKANPEVLYNDPFSKGFILTTITREAAVAKLMTVSTVMDRAFTTAPLKTFHVAAVPDGVAKPVEV